MKSLSIISLFRDNYEFGTRLMSFLTATDVAMFTAAIGVPLGEKDRKVFMSPIRDFALDERQQKLIDTVPCTTTLLGRDCYKIMMRIRKPIQYCRRYGRRHELTFALVVRKMFQSRVEDVVLFDEWSGEVMSSRRWSKPSLLGETFTRTWTHTADKCDIVNIYEMVEDSFLDFERPDAPNEQLLDPQTREQIEKERYGGGVEDFLVDRVGEEHHTSSWRTPMKIYLYDAIFMNLMDSPQVKRSRMFHRTNIIEPWNLHLVTRIKGRWYYCPVPVQALPADDTPAGLETRAKLRHLQSDSD